MKTVYMSLGGNMGNRKRNLENGIEQIEKELGKCVAISSFYESDSWGYRDKKKYLNCVLFCKTALKPYEILQKTQEIEKQLGRKTKSSPSENNKVNYQSRPVDIDILFYDNLVLVSDILTIPHPLLSERFFVLKPLLEIASGLIHPIFKKTICELNELCKDTCVVNKMSF